MRGVVVKSGLCLYSEGKRERKRKRKADAHTQYDDEKSHAYGPFLLLLLPFSAVQRARECEERRVHSFLFYLASTVGTEISVTLFVLQVLKARAIFG